MKKILSFLIFFLVISCDKKKDRHESNPVLSFQNQIIQEGLTGSNAAMIFKNGKVIYNQIANSSAIGDKDIDGKTIFAIHSMSKAVTTVAMMILLDKELYDLNDNLSKYLPEYENINCKGDDGIYPCKNKLKIIHLITHRSGYT